LAETMTRAWQSLITIPAFESILGDPTLRLFRVTPPQNLRKTTTGTGTVTVTLIWDPAAEPGTYYHVYRSANNADGSLNLGGFGAPLPTATKLSGTSFTETITITTGTSYSYSVRATKLQTTGSGSFWNLSQGTIISVP